MTENYFADRDSEGEEEDDIHLEEYYEEYFLHELAAGTATVSKLQFSTSVACFCTTF